MVGLSNPIVDYSFSAAKPLIKSNVVCWHLITMAVYFAANAFGDVKEYGFSGRPNRQDRLNKRVTCILTKFHAKDFTHSTRAEPAGQLSNSGWTLSTAPISFFLALHSEAFSMNPIRP